MYPRRSPLRLTLTALALSLPSTAWGQDAITTGELRVDRPTLLRWGSSSS
jgi:hypothetical protein